MVDEDTRRAKTTCEKSQWLENLWRCIENKKEWDPELYGTSIDIIFAKSVDI